MNRYLKIALVVTVVGTVSAVAERVFEVSPRVDARRQMAEKDPLRRRTNLDIFHIIFLGQRVRNDTRRPRK